MKNTRFYYCQICGNVIGLIDGEANRIFCCGKPVTKLEAKSGIDEKHIPLYEKVEDEIFVTLKNHPMQKEHYIKWVALVAQNKTIRVILYPEGNAEARLPYIKGSTIFAYCNLHGLWQTTVK